ncbi:MAG: hypothetical protein KIT68_11125 [Phycisphaeraceae bacterium]|nr:hypothetical protein [Phycisphaeraceae bacterium]
MNEERFAVPLKHSNTRPVKAGALAVFKAIRWIGSQGAKTPGRLARVKRDITEAWVESRPNA